MRGFAASSELEDERRFRVDDVLALSRDAFLRRATHSGIVRASGGAFERTVWHSRSSAPMAGSRATRPSTSDSEAEALARFDALTRAPRAEAARRRVRANAATRSFERFRAALAARDGEALAQLFDDAAARRPPSEPRSATASRDARDVAIRAAGHADASSGRRSSRRSATRSRSTATSPRSKA